jgi:biofilm PGA synthesis N-glycosyltransferase PgaC
MDKPIQINHIVVTPCKNEEDFISTLIDSMINQTIRPKEWVIIDDGSIDNTHNIIKEASKNEEWIKYFYIKSENNRNRGCEIAKLFSYGIEMANTEDWKYCSKIDADMILPSDYFEKIFHIFDEEKDIGILGGVCFTLSKMGKKKIEKVESDHVRGGLKTYRRKCFQDIGGVLIANGWDGLDEASAQMRGWRTKNLVHIEVEHRRETGSHRGKIINSYISGQYAHFMGYIFPYIFARSIKRMLERPYIIAGLFMLIGFSKNKLFNKSIYQNKEIISFIRAKQAKRLRLNRLYNLE